MQLRVNVPKESVDAILQSQVEDLKKENVKLYNKIRKLESRCEEAERMNRHVKEIHAKMIELCNEYSNIKYDN
jgi:FtsZ-binding cell division protein ZapB